MSRTDARQLAIEAARIAEADRCENVVIQDLRGISEVCDYFVICTGTSLRQMQTVVDDVDERAEQLGHRRYGIAGREEGEWILADYVDVVVHVFSEQARSYYDLELLWGDARVVEGWQDSESTGTPVRGPGE